MLKFWSNIQLVFQIAIVVGVVLLFSFLDPFGIFRSKKQSLENTPVTVESIKQIGQLITAEYYGEVLTSLQESIEQEIKESDLTDDQEFDKLEEQYIEALQEFYDQRSSVKLGIFNKGNKLYDLFYEDYPFLTEYPFYQPFIQSILSEVKKDNNKQRWKNERQLLKELIKVENQKELDEILIAINAVSSNKFKENKREEREVFSSNKTKRKQIVVLGRGSVKAGINFENFTESNFKYDEENRTIHLIGLKPRILTSDINPWFIPEKKVKGFEIVLMTRKARKPELMLRVKQQALDKLTQNAIKAGIVDNARKNAESNLKSFFSLLIPGGIEEVVIHDSFLSYFYEEYVSGTITTDIMENVDSMFIHRYKTDSSEVISLRNDLLKKRMFLRNDTSSYVINRYSSRLRMIEDEILTVSEKNWLIKEKEKIETSINQLRDTSLFLSQVEIVPDRLDSIWSYPTIKQFKEYKKEVDHTLFEEFKWYEVISKDPAYLANQNKKQKALIRKVYIHLMAKRLFAFEQLSSVIKKKTKNVVEGNTTFTTDSSFAESIDTTGEKHAIEFENSLESHLIEITGTIQDLIEEENAVVDTNELKYTFDKMEIHWTNDQERETVIKLLRNVQRDWKLKVLEDTVSIHRYSEWYLYLESDTLPNSWLSFLNKEQEHFRESERILEIKKMKKLSFSQVKSLSSNLDEIWFNPTVEELDEIKTRAEERKYNTPIRGIRTKRKKIFIEVEIQKHILEKKKKAYSFMMKELLQQVNVIEVEKGKYMSISKGKPVSQTDKLPTILTK